MGNIFKRKKEEDPDSAWQEQNREIERNPIYRFQDYKGGKLIDAYRKGGVVAVQEIARKEIQPYLYNGGKGATISKLDYIKWYRQKQAKGSAVLETKSDEELLAEWNEAEKSSFNKVFEHEACWDLNKRGGVGETPLHLLYLIDSAEYTEVAKILLNMFPKLALDFYCADEYYGESCLHLATVYGDFESVKLLVSNGAGVNQRSSGRFFLPEDQKNGRTNTTNYEGFAYYGEYPLAFAVCFAYMDIYDYLIDNGANPNLQDSFGNTALHMAVIADRPEMYKYMVKHHKKQASNDICNDAKLTPLTLASKLGRHKIFKEILEINSIDFWHYSNVTCSAYPLTEIDSISPSGETNWNSALMIVINGECDEHLDMLEGGVMRQLLDDKWKTFARRRFFLRLILTFIHLSLISVAVYLRPASGLLKYTRPADAIRFICEIIVCFFCVIYLIMEVMEIGSQGAMGFIKNCSHAPAHTVFMVSCLLILLCIPFRILAIENVEDVILILAVPGSWFFLLFFARSVKITGPFVTMIYKMCVGDMLRFGIIYLIFLIGFTQGFYFLFRDINVESFNNLPNTIMTLFQMTLGEFKYHDFDLTRYALLTKGVFAVFMILVPILLLNMLIAMMGNTYQSVIMKSEKEWRKQWAKIVVVLERGFTQKQLQKFHREYSIKLAAPAENDEKSEEIRAIVVIKTSPKTKARQRKIAVSNWKKLGREIIVQLKQQKKKGKTGPLKLQKVSKKGGPYKRDGSDDDVKFTNITAQLAWEKDIDLTKGQAFIKDSESIEASKSRMDSNAAGDVNCSATSDNNATTGNISQQTSDKKSSNESVQIANGSASRNMKKYVKKPNGNPKSSPKLHKQFSSNRVSPYPHTQMSESDINHELDMLKKDDTYQLVPYSAANNATKQTNDGVMKQATGVVSHALEDLLADTEHEPPIVLNRSKESKDEKVMYDEWVEELMDTEMSPSKHGHRSRDKHSDSSPDKHSSGSPRKHKKDKKRKKETNKKERSRSKEREDSKFSASGNQSKTPTSLDMLLLGDSDVG